MITRQEMDLKLSTVAHTFDTSSWEEEPRRWVSELKATLVYIVPEQPEPHSETLSQEDENLDSAGS